MVFSISNTLELIILLVRWKSALIILLSKFLIHTIVLIHFIYSRAMTLILNLLQASWQWPLAFLFVFFNLLKLLFSIATSLIGIFISFVIHIWICSSTSSYAMIIHSMYTMWCLWSLTSMRTFFVVSKLIQVIWVAVLMLGFYSNMFLIDTFFCQDMLI